MNTEEMIEEYERLSGELLDVLNSGDADRNSLGRLTCGHLVALMNLTTLMEGGRDMYLSVRTAIEHINVSALRCKQVITVGFMAYNTTMWIGDRLYNLLDSSGRFEPYIYCLRRIARAESKAIDDEYNSCMTYFTDKGFRVCGSMDPAPAAMPDICIWLTPWVDSFTEIFGFYKSPLSTMHVYIPYGLPTCDNAQKDYIGYECNMPINNIVWRTFETSREMPELELKNSYANTNCVYTGYPKMDAFYTTQRIRNKDAKKLIIYAPHHSLADYDVLRYATFQTNYRYMLELAHKYSDKVTWVFKPHPNLRMKVIDTGLFAGEAEWEAYLNEWRSIGDSYVVESGTYAQLFVDSDAMIFDSVSFMEEYLYVDRPALFLTRPEQGFNERGEETLKVHYTAEGSDFDGIESFVRDVVIGELDDRHDARRAYFEEYLDYVGECGGFAADNIYRELRRTFMP